MSASSPTIAYAETDETTSVLADGSADDADTDATGDSASDTPPPCDRDRKPAATPRRLTLLIMAVTIAGLAAVVSWSGLRIYHARQTADHQAQVLQAARQQALNLTTVSDDEADADMKRVLDSSTGTFYDQIQQRSKEFIALVKQTQTKSLGSVADAGIETEQDHQANVLVAVDVKTSTLGSPDQQTRSWRMRLTMQEIGGSLKISNVEFVP